MELDIWLMIRFAASHMGRQDPESLGLWKVVR